MARDLPWWAPYVAGLVLVVIPEPATTITGLGLIGLSLGVDLSTLKEGR